MLNPFLQPMPEKQKHQVQTDSDMPKVQMYGHSLDTATPRASVGLLVGRLLIRMGQMLAKQDSEPDNTKEKA